MTQLGPKIIKAEDEDFMVYFKNEGSPGFEKSWSGQVVDLTVFVDGQVVFTRQDDFLPTENKDEARVLFEWHFCWRGVWDARIYPKQEEYYAEELAVIQSAWQQIEDIIKDQIKADNPDYDFSEE